MIEKDKTKENQNSLSGLDDLLINNLLMGNKFQVEIVDTKFLPNSSNVRIEINQRYLKICSVKSDRSCTDRLECVPQGTFYLLYLTQDRTSNNKGMVRQFLNGSNTAYFLSQHAYKLIMSKIENLEDFDEIEKKAKTTPLTELIAELEKMSSKKKESDSMSYYHED